MTPLELLAWTYAAMLHVAPVERLPQFPGFEETHDEARARYVGIAATIATVCAPSKTPKGCASLLVALGAGESGFSLDTDRGPRCYHGPGHKTRCDASTSVSVWQVKGGWRDAAGDVVTTDRLFADRALAARRALRVAHSSLSLCRDLAPHRRLSALSGQCINRDGPWSARWRLWLRLRTWDPATVAKPSSAPARRTPQRLPSVVQEPGAAAGSSETAAPSNRPAT